MPFIYLDSAASALPNRSLPRWYAELLETCFVNPHGGTCYAETCRRIYLEAARRLLALLAVPDNEARVIFTSGVTEALALAMNGYESFIVEPTSHSAVFAASSKAPRVFMPDAADALPAHR